MSDLFPRASRAAGYRDTGPQGPSTWTFTGASAVATGSNGDECPFLDHTPNTHEDSVDASNTTVPQFTEPATVTPEAEPTGEVTAMGGGGDGAELLDIASRTPPPRPSPARADWEASPVAQWGLRGVLNRLLHVSLLAGAAETAWTKDRNAIRRASWSRMQRLSVLGLEGGVGRTTLTAALTLALGEARRGEVVGIDLTTDSGPLGSITERGGLGIDGLLCAPSVDTVAAMRSFTARQPTPGDVLAWTEAPPSHPLTVEDIDRITTTVERYYTVAVRDLDASPWAPTWAHAVASSDALLVAATPTVRGARAAERARHHIKRVAPHLLASCVYVGVGGMPPSEDGTEWLVIPHDPGFNRNVVHWDALHRRTRTALTAAARAAVTTLKEN